MDANPVDPAVIDGWHAHVYFDEHAGEPARRLREAVEAGFAVEMGRWLERPIGPHPIWSYQIAFAPAVFPALVPFLTLNHGDLTVFIHPNTGQDLEDHRDRALWLGRQQALDLSIFDRA